MSDAQASNGKTPDPLEQWQGMRDAYLEAWAKVFNDTVKSDAYAQTTGVMLDAALTASSPLRVVLQKTMLTTLEQLSMPTRDDFVSLAERLTNVEVRLDDMDAKLDRIENLLSRLAPQATTKTAASGAKKKGAK